MLFSLTLDTSSPI